MTEFNMKEYLGNLTSHVMFEYNGYSCGVDPLARDNFDMWYGDESMTAHSIDEVMTTKFFDGKSLENILDDITDLEYQSILVVREELNKFAKNTVPLMKGVILYGERLYC